MSRIPSILRDTRLYPAWVLLFAAAVLFVRLGSYGFWEPGEVTVADRANEIANPEPGDEIPVEGVKKKPQHRQLRSELDAELVAEMITRTGRGEGSGRFPLALLALVTILATYFIGHRVRGPKAGLIAAAIIVCFPALLLNGRHLNSEIGSAAGSALVVLGLLGLLSRRGFGFRTPRDVLVPIDVMLVVIGGYLSYRAAGALLGVVPPFVAVGIAAATAIRRTTEKTARLYVAFVAVIGITVAAVAFAYFFTAVFDVVDPDEVAAERAAKAGPKVKVAPAEDGYTLLAGRDLEVESGYVPELGGAWRKTGDKRIGFSSTLEAIAIGSFPWIAVIPIALLALLIGRGKEQTAPRTAIALWALAAYVVGAVFARKVGGAMYPAWGALAVAAGVWLADVFSDDDDGPRGALPLAAFFVVCAAMVVGKDILAFPEKLLELNLKGSKLAFPKGVKIQFVWVVVGWAAALGLATALATRDLETKANGRLARVFAAFRRTAQAGGLAAGLGLGLLSAIIFTQVLTPTLSKKLSSKNILGVYQELRSEGDVLGIMGQAGGASYYAGTEFERIRGRSALLAFLERPERVFALAPASERCPLNKAARKKGLPYFVVDDSSAQYLLFSNKLKDGEKDVNPLKSTFFSELPKDIRKSLSWNFDDRIELVGVSMPDSVRKGSAFKMKLYFKVLKPLSRNWKVFMHFDTGVRFQGDHDPIGGTCGTTSWLPGDYVVDEFEVTAGSRTHPAGNYRIWMGLFVGSAGNYTNMKVVTKGADANNRIPIGSLKLK